jgi:large subunit ribosomal protein L31
MAQSIDIQTFANATATCSNCGSVYSFPSAIENLKVEICGNCHPFYTGQDTVVDTAGRIEKFEARMAKTQQLNSGEKAVKKTKPRKTRQSLVDIMPEPADNNQVKTTDENPES